MSTKTFDPRDPRRGRRGLDAPVIPGSIPPDVDRAEAQERSGLNGVKWVVIPLVIITFVFTFIEMAIQVRGQG
jgi:hypothetical protein